MNPESPTSARAISAITPPDENNNNDNQSKRTKLDNFDSRERSLSPNRSFIKQSSPISTKYLSHEGILSIESPSKQSDEENVTLLDNKQNKRVNGQTNTTPEKLHNDKKSKSKSPPISNSPHDLYIELEVLYYSEHEMFYDSCGELSNYQWKIVSRWIKYEQAFDHETNIWSKPFVGALVYQNLVYLKNTLQYGTIILNSLKETFEGVIDDVLMDFIVRGHMTREHKAHLKNMLLSQHRSKIGVAGALTGKRAPVNELFSSSWHQSKLKLNSHSIANNHSFVIHNNVDMLGSRKSSMIYTSNQLSPHRQTGGDRHQHINMSQLNIEDKKPSAAKFYLSANSNDTILDNTPTNLHKNRRSTFNMIKNTIIPHSKNSRSNLSTLQDVEVALMMVGVVDFLDRPVMAFVKLTNDQYIDHFTEYQVKVRFIFIFLGPSKSSIDYYEIGRCMGTVMADKDFQSTAYTAKKRQDIIRGITQFSSKSLCLVLPLGEFDIDLLNPLLEWMRRKTKSKMNKMNHKMSIKSKDSLDDAKYNLFTDPRTIDKANHHNHVEAGLMLSDEPYKEEEVFDPFKRTGKPFGALFKEIRYRYKKYLSDIRDGLNLHCMIAFVFIFTVCVVPALSFGGILGDKTDDWFGLNEMLLATSINGVFFGLFSGQPLLIFGPTGPFIVFEEMLYNFSVKLFCIEYLATRVWISIWILIFTLIVLAFESVFIIHFVTRFTEEIFAILIASVFLADAIKKIFYYFNQNPIYTGEMYCDLYNKTHQVGLTSILDELTTTSSLAPRLQLENDSLSSNGLVGGTTSSNWMQCKRGLDFSDHENTNTLPEPNLALISVMLLIGTCTIALLLKKLRRSNFFGSYIRRTLSDVGILIAIVLMVLVDFLIRQKTQIDTQKLEIPEELVPTNKLRKSWFVSPFGNNYETYQYFPWWVPLVAIFPASIIFIVLFFEIELISIILSAEHRKLKKGTGFNLDLLLGAIMMNLNSFLGLPWMCAAPVRTLAHWASLSIYNSSIIPGEKPKLVRVLEQRITNILVHIAIGLCLKAKLFLRMIPVPALFGIILYFGIVSLSGTQFYERIKFVFIPFKYCPNLPYANGVRPSKRNLFTLLQILAVAALLALKSYANVSFLFPVVLVLLVPFRRFILPRLFTQRELEQLDDDGEDQEDDMMHDFYELTHMPI